MGSHHQRHGDELDDRREVLHRVVRDLAIEVRIDDVGNRGEEQRVTVRAGPGRYLGRDQPAGAAAVIHHHRLPERLGKPLRGDPSQDVRCAPGREADDQADRALRILLCRRRQPGSGQRGAQQYQ